MEGIINKNNSQVLYESDLKGSQHDLLFSRYYRPDLNYVIINGNLSFELKFALYQETHTDSLLLLPSTSEISQVKCMSPVTPVAVASQFKERRWK